MSNAAIDINSTSRYLPQFDPDVPPTQFEALIDEECETAAERFVEWLASEEQAERLYYLIVERLQEDDVKAAAKQWAKEMEHE